MRRFVPFALLIPLSTLFVSCSKGDMSNTPNPQAQVIDASKGSVVTDNASPIIVTEDNFPQAYTNLRFDAIINQAGGLNTFREMSTAPSDPAKQFVVRMNRDTHYSTAVFDMTDGVYLTIPETDKYISVQVVDENHETQPMIYGPGRHKLTAKTKYAFIAVRSLDDQARRNLKAEANSSDPFAVKEWDNESFDKVAASGNTVFTTGYEQSKAFSNTESGQTPYWNYVGAAGGWGGAMVVDNIYQTSQYMSSDGCYEMTFADPEARDFWSATVYNGDGYMFNDVANISSEMDPEKNSDGTYTLRFGCVGQANNIPIREGNKTGKFNILVRHYGPSKMVSENEEGYNPTKNIKKVN